MSAIGEKLAAQQRATAARALAAMERAHLAERWERQREAERAWAYFRAGQPVPDEMPALTRARAILSAKDPWDTIPIAKADLAELVAIAEKSK